MCRHLKCCKSKNVILNSNLCKQIMSSFFHYCQYWNLKHWTIRPYSVTLCHLTLDHSPFLYDVDPFQSPIASNLTNAVVITVVLKKGTIHTLIDQFGEGSFLGKLLTNHDMRLAAESYCVHSSYGHFLLL